MGFAVLADDRQRLVGEGVAEPSRFPKQPMGLVAVGDPERAGEIGAGEVGHGLGIALRRGLLVERAGALAAFRAAMPQQEEAELKLGRRMPGQDRLLEQVAGQLQVLLYADAVERAGTFYPPEVIKALEDYEFDGLGNGPTTYRGSDHQCFKEVYAVKGKDAPANPFDLLEVVGTASKESVTYDPAIFGGELGPDTTAAC